MTKRKNRWDDVAAAVSARMDALGYLVQADFVRDTGISDPTVRVFQTGRLRGNVEPSDGSRKRMSVALGWSPDSIDRLLRGEEPVEVEPADELTKRVAALEAKVQAQGKAIHDLADRLAAALNGPVEAEAEDMAAGE